MSPVPSNRQDILQQADRCVKCGLCLAVCPTYALQRSEADSPRGRIDLVQGLLSDELAPSPRLTQHLEGCLHCLNCQRACPSGVEYSLIIDAGLAQLARPRQRGPRLLARWGGRPWLQRLLRLSNPAPLRGLARRLSWGRWRRLLELLPVVAAPPSPHRPCATGQTALFLGCIGQINDNPALHAFQQLCQALDIDLCIPPTQVCCGGLARHRGDIVESERLRTVNTQAFAQADGLVSLSSGCGAELRNPFASRLEDASAFLLRQAGLAQLRFRPLMLTVAIHTPCSLRNGLAAEQAPGELLRRIPGLRLVNIENTHGCCGGAGLHLLDQPELADRLANPLVAQIRALNADCLVTSNSGCALHLRRALRQAGLELDVLHPVELLARQRSSTRMQDDNPPGDNHEQP